MKRRKEEQRRNQNGNTKKRNGRKIPRKKKRNKMEGTNQKSRKRSRWETAVLPAGGSRGRGNFVVVVFFFEKRTHGKAGNIK